VDVRLNDPQVAAGAQVQATPLFAASLMTEAEIFAVPEVCSEGGGAVPKATEIGKVIVADADLELSEAAVGRIVTLPLAGAAAGAV